MRKVAELSLTALLMRKTFIIISGVLIAVFALWLMLVVGQRRTDWPKLSVTLLGYTNNATGSRLATFAVTNLSQSPVIREAGYSIQSPGSNLQNGNNISWNLFTGGRNSRLQPGEAETLLVVTPTNQSSWRILFSVRYPESMATRVVRETLDWASIPGHSFSFQSDWIDQ